MNPTPDYSQGRKPWAGIREHLRCKKRGLSSSRLLSGNLLFKVATAKSLVAADKSRCDLCGEYCCFRYAFASLQANQDRQRKSSFRISSKEFVKYSAFD